jgi:hypothetical protein
MLAGGSIMGLSTVVVQGGISIGALVIVSLGAAIGVGAALATGGAVVAVTNGAVLWRVKALRDDNLIESDIEEFRVAAAEDKPRAAARLALADPEQTPVGR